MANVKVTSGRNYENDLYLESSLRLGESRESCIPRTVISLTTKHKTAVPVINLSGHNLTFSSVTIPAVSDLA